MEESNNNSEVNDCLIVSLKIIDEKFSNNGRTLYSTNKRLSTWTAIYSRCHRMLQYHQHCRLLTALPLN